jgi:hypothetical protein
VSSDLGMGAPMAVVAAKAITATTMEERRKFIKWNSTVGESYVGLKTGVGWGLTTVIAKYQTPRTYGLTTKLQDICDNGHGGHSRRA